MTTPLQQAAQSVIARWDSPAWKDQPHTAHFIDALRKALDAELQQSVEPVLYIDARTLAMDNAHVGAWKPGHELDGNLPLYLHPPQQAESSGERAALIELLRDLAPKLLNGRMVAAAADMLESDAQQATEHLSKAFDAAVNEFGAANLAKAISAPEDQRAELIAKLRDAHGRRFVTSPSTYSQAADMLEADAQQAKQVPLNDEQIDELAEGIAWDDYAHDLTRRVEAHHGIGGEA